TKPWPNPLSPVLKGAQGTHGLGTVSPGLWCPPGPHGQQHWHEGHPECGGRAQSPIDIVTARAQPDLSLPPLQPEGYEQPESPRLTLANNGHTAVLALPPSLRLRGLSHPFTAVQLHFHWGRPGRAAGAEHLLDGHRAPAEVPGNASEMGLGALDHTVPPPSVRCANNILRHLGSIRYAGQSVAIPTFSIRELLPAQLERYYRYNGSLTTPPCSESVLWSLLPQPVRISQAQVGPALLWGNSCLSPLQIKAFHPPAGSSWGKNEDLWGWIPSPPETGTPWFPPELSPPLPPAATGSSALVKGFYSESKQ
uniref:Carbonic anhydrase 14 n=1 Tax=Malurus cyaneus samueli TaxID=2593467 RepID=A0A8C5TH28_9PASS